MDKIDLKRELKHLYRPSAHEPQAVEVPPLNYLMIDGKGDPNRSPAYQQALEALYALAYTIKFALKKAGEMDFVVMPLESLWWSDEADSLDLENKEQWQWTAMILLPEAVTQEHFARAQEEVRRKKDPPDLARVRMERLEEGLSAQILHVGPYAEEGPTIARLHQFIQAQGCQPIGRHHEIYLSDPRRTDPERLKTIIRQPMSPAADV